MNFPGAPAFAHLFEHMMFEGSKHVPGNGHIRFLEGAGASDLNGTTDFDRTNYFETIPSNQLELALWAGIGSHGIFARPARPGQPDQSAGRGCETNAARASRTRRTESGGKRITSCSPRGILTTLT